MLSRETLASVKQELPTSFHEGWEEFVEGLTYVRGQPHNSIGIAEFIRDEVVVHGVKTAGLRFPQVHYFPGISTSLGVLGTFFGITLGLADLDIHDNGGESIATLVGSLAGAFVTSIIGVFFSLLINLFGGGAETSLLGALHDFHEAVERKIPRVTAERLLAESIALQEKQEQILQDTREETEDARAHLQTIATDLADSISNNFQRTIEDLLIPHIAKMSEVVSSQVSSAGQNSEKQARRFTDEMVQQLSGGLQASFQTMGEQVGTVGRQFVETAGSLEKVMTDASKIIEAHRGMLAAERELLSGFKRVADDFKAALGQAAPMLSGMSSTAEALVQQQAQLQTLVGSVDKLSGRLEAASGTLVEGLGQAEGALQSSAAQIKEVVANAGQWATTANSAIERFGTSMKEVVGSSLRQYDESLSTAVKNLGGTMRDLEDIAEDIRANSAPAGA